jgi:16S rRNA (cytosine1402-N4)-methyltransferase
VLLDETLELLDPRPHSVIVDGTVGGGGHAAAILDLSAPDGRLVGLDRDEDALEAASERLAPYGDRVRLVHTSFRSLAMVLKELGIPRVDGVLLDLGVSSWQLDEARRGFRFGGRGAEEAAGVPLDMRMDSKAPTTAADLLARLPEEELERCFRDYGELPGARRLARAIVEARRERPLETAADLLALVRETGVGRRRRHNPATLVFQALRIAVNDELAALEEGLAAAIEALAPGRRIVVLAYHSLEDRIVKNAFRDGARGCVCPPSAPVCICGRQPTVRVITRRPVSPGDDEIAANPRARSARLRAAERLPEAC